MIKRSLLSLGIFFPLASSHCYIPWCSFFVSGETLQDERINGGAFVGVDGGQFPPKLIPVSYIIVSGLLFSVHMSNSFFIFFIFSYWNIFIITILFWLIISLTLACELPLSYELYLCKVGHLIGWLNLLCRMQGCAFMVVHSIIGQWLNFVL